MLEHENPTKVHPIFIVFSLIAAGIMAFTMTNHYFSKPDPLKTMTLPIKEVVITVEKGDFPDKDSQVMVKFLKDIKAFNEGCHLEGGEGYVFINRESTQVHLICSKDSE